MRFGQMKHMNRRSALLGIAALAIATPALAQQVPTQVVLQGPERAAALARASAALNGVGRLQARFTQWSPGGARAGGTLYMQRPGLLRFQYDAPASMLIVSDGSVVYLRDTELRTTDRTPLRSTPLNLILRNQVNLERDARITRVASEGDRWLVITARDRSGQTDGEITMFFEGPNAQLVAWDITDATGARTRINLSGLTQPASFDRALFRLEDQLERDRGGRRH